MKRADDVQQVRSELKRRANVLIAELDRTLEMADADLVALDKISITLKVSDVQSILNEIMRLREHKA